MMTADQERWAEALMVERQHGDSAAQFVEARIDALTRDGDQAGVERWRAIGARLFQLGHGDG